MVKADIRKAMTIAGSDSGGGAGIQADLKTFAALGVYGTSAITSLTAQNTLGVQGVHTAPPDFVALQIASIAADIGADAVKTGMLASAEIILAVAGALQKHGFSNIVVDPVMVAKSGDPLLADAAVETLVRCLFPLASVVTPNLHEAARLTGKRVETREDMREAARAVHGQGPAWVVVKGGHLKDTPCDLLFDGKDFMEFPGPRFDTPNTHGTGCTFSSAVAAFLAKGHPVPRAVELAKGFVARAIEGGLAVGAGHGPTHHLTELYRAAGMDFSGQRRPGP